MASRAPSLPKAGTYTNAQLAARLQVHVETVKRLSRHPDGFRGVRPLRIGLNGTQVRWCIEAVEAAIRGERQEGNGDG